MNLSLIYVKIHWESDQETQVVYSNLPLYLWDQA